MKGSMETKLEHYQYIFKNTTRVRESNRKETALLLNNVRGAMSIRSFAETLGVNPSTISRILSYKTGEVSEDLLARIAAYADAENRIVTADELMKAQGLVKTNVLDVIDNFELKCRGIISDGLLQKGYKVSYENVLDVRVSRKDFAIRTDAIGAMEEDWIFECKKVYSMTRIQISNGPQWAWIDKAMSYFYRGKKAKRISLVVDEGYIFDQLKYLLSCQNLPDEISVLLVSINEGKVLDEYVAPMKDGSTPISVFRNKERTDADAEYENG